MTEEEKLDAGLYYDFWDVGVNGRKLNAIKFCRELRRMQDADATEDEQAVLIKKYFGSVGSDVCLCPGFMCVCVQALCVTAAKIFMLGISFLQITMSQFLISCRCILAIM